MAHIGFDGAAYNFSQGCKNLRESYVSAAVALSSKFGQTSLDVERYKKFVDAGGAPNEERDEEGFLLWSQEQLFEMDLDNLREAELHLRKAFVIAIYHHWERSIRIWAEVPHDKRHHSHLVEIASQKGVLPHPHLNSVRDLTNLLKHNSPDYAKKLFDTWPEIIAGSPFTWSDDTDFYNRIHLGDADIDRAFEAVKCSGPQIIITRTSSD